MTRQVALLSVALAVLAGCSGDGGDDSASTAASVTGGNSASASGGTTATSTDAATGGSTATSSGGGAGGSEARDASAATTDANVDEDPTPNYGDLNVLPDTSGEKVADCSGQPDMTLCDVVTTPDRAYDICVDEKCVSPGCGDPSCNAPGPHFHIPPFVDHHALQVEAGAEPITIDLITGLHWQSCLAGNTGSDCKTGTALQLRWNDAVAYCDALSWGGHSDWYLPDPYELVSIMEDDLDPATDAELSPSAFPIDLLVAPFCQWTSACMGPSQAMAISISAANLDAIETQQSSDTMVGVRCVRRGFSRATSPAHARYAQSADATKPVFVDRATGLVWPACLVRIPGATQCSDLLDKVTTEKALKRCDALEWAGSGAWRVPSYKELQSLIRYPHDAASTEAKLDDRVVSPAGPFLITAEGQLFATDGRRVDLGMSGTYPYLCVRGPASMSN